MPDPMPASEPQHDTTATVPWSTGPLAELMTQLSDLVRLLDDEQFNAQPESTQCGAIGGHVRHVLDHLVAWLGGVEHGRVNYDDRQRDTAIEHDPTAALHAIKHHTARLASVSDEQLANPVTVLTSMTRCGSLVALPSTHARELAFVFSHTIHHNAIIGTIARALRIDLPEHFGTAPSTIAYRNQSGCAR
ncbi:MAG: DinB family protein [Phycisphaeraceae bacterium]